MCAVRNVCGLVSCGGRTTRSTRRIIITEQLQQQQALKSGGGHRKSAPQKNAATKTGKQCSYSYFFLSCFFSDHIGVRWWSLQAFLNEGETRNGALGVVQRQSPNIHQNGKSRPHSWMSTLVDCYFIYFWYLGRVCIGSVWMENDTAKCALCPHATRPACAHAWCRWTFLSLPAAVHLVVETKHLNP